MNRDENVSRYRECAEAGFTIKETAELLGRQRSAVYAAARTYGLIFAAARRGRPAGIYKAPTDDVLSRASRMAEMYRNGCTLQAIGDEFSLTRERVRQIITKHHGMNRLSGGNFLLVNSKNDARRVARDRLYLDKHGCTFKQFCELRALGRKMVAAGGLIDRTPLRAFGMQKSNARRRGIGWELKLWDWWQIWLRSGKWEQRGRGQGYMMCRIGDNGPYAIGNVFIAPGFENSSRQKRKTSDLPTGVRRVRNGFAARRMIYSKTYELGTFATPEQARAAYLSFTPPNTQQVAA